MQTLRIPRLLLAAALAIVAAALALTDDAPPAQAQSPPPAEVTNLSVKAFQDRTTMRLKVTWHRGAYGGNTGKCETRGYQVRLRAKGGNWISWFYNASGASLSYTIPSSLSGGTTYQVMVRARCSSAVWSSWSSIAEETVPHPPGAPRNVRTIPGDDRVTVTWDPPARPGTWPRLVYKIYEYYTDPDGVNSPAVPSPLPLAA